MEVSLRRVEPGSLSVAMAPPPKVVKLDASQVRKPPWMKSPVRDVISVIKSSAIERNNNESITEDKKA